LARPAIAKLQTNILFAISKNTVAETMSIFKTKTNFLMVKMNILRRNLLEIDIVSASVFARLQVTYWFAI
jgi:hypothetical protein